MEELDELRAIALSRVFSFPVGPPMDPSMVCRAVLNAAMFLRSIYKTNQSLMHGRISSTALRRPLSPPLLSICPHLFPIHFEGIFFKSTGGSSVDCVVTDPNSGQTSAFQAWEKELIEKHAPGEYYFVGVVFFDYKKQNNSFHILQNQQRADVRGRVRQFLDLSEVFFVEKNLSLTAGSPLSSWYSTKETSSEFYLQIPDIPDETLHYCCFRAVLPSYKVSNVHASDAGAAVVQIRFETGKERHLSGMDVVGQQPHAGYLLWKPSLVSNSISDFDVDVGCADTSPEGLRAGCAWRQSFDVQSLAASCFKLLAKDLCEGPYSPLPASVRKFVAQDSLLKQNLQLHPYLDYPYTKARDFVLSVRADCVK
jgi:hypothetical protein